MIQSSFDELSEPVKQGLTIIGRRIHAQWRELGLRPAPVEKIVEDLARSHFRPAVRPLLRRVMRK